jgi:hypothetical protein
MKYLKGYRYWLLLCLCGVIVGLSLYFHTRNSKWATFEKIKPGMTEAQVVDLMGKDHFSIWTSRPELILAWEEDASLFSDHYRVQVDFDDQRRVAKKYRLIIEPSHFRRFFDSLGW